MNGEVHEFVWRSLASDTLHLSVNAQIGGLGLSGRRKGESVKRQNVYTEVYSHSVIEMELKVTCKYWPVERITPRHKYEEELAWCERAPNHLLLHL